MTILSATSDAAKVILPLITIKGELRASKPKDGNAAYVWRMVGFTISKDSRMHCMPMTADFGVVVPDDWKVEAPEDWLQEQIDKPRTASDESFVRRESKDGTVRGYFVHWWSYSQRRKAFIKEVLDPIVNEIIASVPVTEQHGTKRWARAFGVI